MEVHMHADEMHTRSVAFTQFDKSQAGSVAAARVGGCLAGNLV